MLNIYELGNRSSDRRPIGTIRVGEGTSTLLVDPPRLTAAIGDALDRLPAEDLDGYETLAALRGWSNGYLLIAD